MPGPVVRSVSEPSRWGRLREKAAFSAYAYDFIQMAAISAADMRLAGSHAGVSIGEDGPSQMALEDIAAFRALDTDAQTPSGPTGLPANSTDWARLGVHLIHRQRVRSD